MKTLQKVTLIVALLCLAVMTPSCKKDKNENPENTTPKSLDLVIACGLSDAYFDLANVKVEITDHNGNKVVETMTKDLSDYVINGGNTINLLQKTFTIENFPATLTWKYNITKKDLQGNYDLPCFQHGDSLLYVKDLGEGYGAYEGQNTSLGKQSWFRFISYPDGFSTFVEQLNNTVVKVNVDKDGNIVLSK